MHFQEHNKKKAYWWNIAMANNNKGCFPLIALQCYTKHDVQPEGR